MVQGATWEESRLLTKRPKPAQGGGCPSTEITMCQGLLIYTSYRTGEKLRPPNQRASTWSLPLVVQPLALCNL